MKKLIFTLTVLLFTTTTVSFAQNQDDYKSLLNRMLQEAGTQTTFKVAVQQMFSMFKQQKSNVPTSVWEGFEQEFLSTSMDELVDMLLPVYQKHFSSDDLRGIIAFYQTPVGKKLAKETPFVMRESMQIGQEWGKRLAASLAEKMKAKGY